MEEDDGVLSEIEPDSVPNEVRDWLAMTFTRSMSTIKRRPSDKPKFKSVAQAIRAGIMVDRFVNIFLFSSFLITILSSYSNETKLFPKSFLYLSLSDLFDIEH